MFWRLRCHFCGTRSTYSRGTLEFECSNCQALNFFDADGEVAEPPSTITNPPQAQQLPPGSTSPSASSASLAPRGVAEEQIFCQRCLNNQRMYVDALNSYLPDEDHPRYKEYIDKLPKKKADLEHRYPQVCKNCAPKVQERIYQADYHGMAQSAAVAMNKTSIRRRHGAQGRDDWSKWSMRIFLNICSMLVYGSLLAQVLWHAHAIGVLLFSTSMDNGSELDHIISEPSLRQCARQSLLQQFNLTCQDLLGSAIPKMLLASLFLLWYHPALKDWYHHTLRIEAVHGRTGYLQLQVLLLLIRSLSWYKLHDTETSLSLSKQQLLAAHGFMIAFMPFAQLLSQHSLRSEKWKLRGSIMPRPSEKDVFGATAGPVEEKYARLASSTHPQSLFARDSEPFPIKSLAPASRNTRGYSNVDLTAMKPVSPADTDAIADVDVDAMDVDSPTVSRTAGMPGKPIDRTFRPKNHGQSSAQTRSIYNHGTTQPSGWGAMVNEVFGMQDSIRIEDGRKRQAQEQRSKLRFEPPAAPSPFRGRLPQAPMSVERRLRNPVTQVTFKQTPLSKQQDFMKQMRDSFESGRTFGKMNSGHEQVVRNGRLAREDMDEEDEDLSPAKSRTRGSLDLRPATWHLPGDAAQTTGLEDLLGGKSFAIADDTDSVLSSPAQLPSKTAIPLLPIWVALTMSVLVAAWNVESIRRPVCLWLIEKLESIGV